MSTIDIDVGGPAGAEPLAETVARLRAERDGLRRAMQTRALIEQAKGVLMARHRLTADQAFDRLLEISQRSNVKAAQVAAAIVATVSPQPGGPTAPDSVGPAGPPGPAGPGPTGSRPARGNERARAGAAKVAHGDPAHGDPAHGSPAHGSPARADRAQGAPAATGGSDPRTGVHAHHLLTVARLHAAESYEDIVDAVTGMRPAPMTVVLLLREADDALRLVAAYGVTAEAASQWGRIPPQVEVPLTDAARSGEPVWLSDRAAADRAYPIMEAIGGPSRSLAALPLLAAGRVVGVLGATWTEDGFGGEHNRPFLAALGEVCGPVAARIAAAAGLSGTDDAWLLPVLDQALGPALALTPVRDGDRITDFAVEFRNARAAAEASRHGQRTEPDPVLTELPGSAADRLMPLYRQVLADGEPRELDDLVVPGRRPGEQDHTLHLRVGRLGDRLVASWRTRSPGELLFDEFVATERVARVASFRWRPRIGQWVCSPTLPELLDWPRGGPPLTPATAWRAVEDRYWAAVRRAVVTVLRTGLPVTVTGATRRGRWLRAVLSRTPEGGLGGTVQDVSETLARRRGTAMARGLPPRGLAPRA